MKTIYGIWLGLSLAIVGYDLTTWQFYFVMVPTVILVAVFHSDSK